MRQPLSRGAIVEAALAEVDAKGLEGLSMRGLGSALGVEAMALYHHFPSKGELLDAVMDRLLAEAELPEPGSMPPLDRLRKFVRSYRQIAVRHPQAFILLAVRRFNTDAAFERYEQILGALAEVGFDAEQSARFFRLIGYYTGGAGLGEVASRAQEPDATPVRLESFTDAERFPRVAAIAPYLRVGKLEGVFEFGLDVIFQAMQAQAKARKKGKSSQGTGA